MNRTHFDHRLTRPGLSGSWSIGRRPPFPPTPGSSTTARARCWAVDVRLHQLGKVSRSRIRVSPGRTGFAGATADVFAFSGSDGAVARTAAESATWRTSNFHGQYLSTDKINQTYPDAPDRTQCRGGSPVCDGGNGRAERSQAGASSEPRCTAGSQAGAPGERNSSRT